jgi:hypothetical protein
MIETSFASLPFTSGLFTKIIRRACLPVRQGGLGK